MIARRAYTLLANKINGHERTFQRTQTGTNLHIDRSQHQTNVGISWTTVNVETLSDEDLGTLRWVLEKPGV